MFFLPLIIKDLGFSNLRVSYLAAMPAALGAAGMILVSRSSDRSGERIWHITLPPLLAAVALLVYAEPDRQRGDGQKNHFAIVQ